MRCGPCILESLHCEAAHSSTAYRASVAPMERMLLLWDEFDDWIGAGRHVIVSAIAGRLDWLRHP